jgi:hypothetical protein
MPDPAIVAALATKAQWLISRRVASLNRSPILGPGTESILAFWPLIDIIDHKRRGVLSC